MAKSDRGFEFFVLFSSGRTLAGPEEMHRHIQKRSFLFGTLWTRFLAVGDDFHRQKKEQRSPGHFQFHRGNRQKEKSNCFLWKNLLFFRNLTENFISVFLMSFFLFIQAKLLLFPEGRRHFGNSLFPFKKGAFHMAIASQLPIQPVVVSKYYFLDHKMKRFNSGKFSRGKNIFLSSSFT